MSPATGNCRRIRHIVQIRQMLLRWRRKAARAPAVRSPSPSPDVPAGHVAVRVGPRCRRFVVRATHLNHPAFQKLLAQAEEEYGFCTQGPLTMPCDESVFEEALRVVSRSGPGRANRCLGSGDLRRRCHVDVLEFVGGESWPLLRGETMC